MDSNAFRGLILLFPMLAVGAACARKPPTTTQAAAASLAALWCLPSLLAVHGAAARLGLWSYQPTPADLLGMPADLLFAWALLWGALPVLAWPGANSLAVLLLALGTDPLYMPRLAPAVVLHRDWWIGEALALLVVLAPAQAFARWTMGRSHLAARASMQCLTFFGLVFVILPAIVLEQLQRPWPSTPSQFLLALWAAPAVIGLSALQEFVERGRGTPIPFDAPARLVQTGIYSYVRNPMQLAITLLLPAVLYYLTGWLGLAGFVLAVVYSEGYAKWDEQQDLTERFGVAWTNYAHRVPRWLPLFKPSAAPAQLHVDAECERCRGVARALERLGPVNLFMLPASPDLQRITYKGADGYVATGVEAVARALEHVHFGWALIAMTVRLPVLCVVIQWINDVSGGPPRNATPPPAGARPPSPA